MALYDLATSWIYDVRTVRVLDLSGQITNKTVTSVVGTDVFSLGNFLGHDGIFEARCLESHAPIVHAGYQIRHPLLGSGGGKVVNYLVPMGHPPPFCRGSFFLWDQTAAGRYALWGGCFVVIVYIRYQRR